MASQIHGVSIKVHPSFFDNVFEKKRKKLQKRLNISNLSQMKFTEYLAKNGARIKIPKKKKLVIKNPLKGRRFYA
jgi:hypothetical protein